MPSTRAVFSCEEAKISCLDPNLHQLTVEAAGQSEAVVNHSGVEVSIGPATDLEGKIRVTVIDSNGRVHSTDFDSTPS